MPIPPIVELTDGSLPKGPQFWLDAATAQVRRYCEWHITPEVQEDLILDGSGTRSLLIPSGHVKSLVSCTDQGVDVLADVDVSEKGVLTRRSGCWSRRNGSVRVTVLHGFESAPDVAGVIAEVAARAATSPGNVVRQNTGPMGVGYATVGGAPISLPLLQSEKDILAPYKLVWGP
ncbi:hypothetical protein [Paenarthrobacter nitroguajacolicus]|uniref:hypothetical protein n=1 Tax=Paenarthrobacter nitroguajacolicus TaxID=211146 RepID=UPI0015BBD019|nr:hypothetical protein [Paenarthrobacter nitroguajacolicus]NWL34435.1 hypothetical protein [Paenarthrobacter nitroguajacolicus]